MKGLKIVATGRCLPARQVTNEVLSRTVDTSDEWIVSRTGIKTRYYCGEETVSDLAAGAAAEALRRAGISPEELGACVVATVSPESAAPAAACRLQRDLGLPEDIPCFDLNAGCTGFVYGLTIVRGLLLQSRQPYALLVGAEALSRITDFTDRSTCVLFGDGAGAVVVTLEEGALWGSNLNCRGGDDALFIHGPGESQPFIRMDGQKVFRFATEALPRCARTLLDETGLSVDQVDWFVPHQANRRIIESAAKKLNAPIERFYQNMERYGNTSAASIPMALDEMVEQGLLKRGQNIMCIGFGAGLTWGGVLLEW